MPRIPPLIQAAYPTPCYIPVDLNAATSQQTATFGLILCRTKSFLITRLWWEFINNQLDSCYLRSKRLGSKWVQRRVSCMQTTVLYVFRPPVQNSARHTYKRDMTERPHQPHNGISSRNRPIHRQTDAIQTFPNF
jgi:hypothetical protein